MRDAADDIYTAKPLDYDTSILKPKGVINVDRIRSQRRGIMRVLLSLIMQENTQSNIRKTYNGIFQGKRIVENRVSAHAARLVANCIVAYNSMILNAVYQRMLAGGASQEVIDEFTRISPIAWTHTLFTGRDSFKKSSGKIIDVEAMARLLEEHVKQHFWRDHEHQN